MQATEGFLERLVGRETTVNLLASLNPLFGRQQRFVLSRRFWGPLWLICTRACAICPSLFGFCVHVTAPKR